MNYSEKRMGRALELMKEKQLDGLMFAVGANFQYLLDWNDFFWQRACMHNIAGQHSALLQPSGLLYLDRSGDYRVFLTPAMAQNAPQDDHIVVSYMDQFEDACSRYISGFRFGLGYGCKAYMEAMFKEIVPSADLLDAEDLLSELRAVKDEKEIAILRANARFTDEAVDYVIHQFHEGMTCWEAEQCLMEYGMKCGMPDFSFPPTIGFKTRQTESAKDVFGFRRSDVLVPGTAVAFDVGFVNHGYCSDWGRTVYWGEAPAYVRDGYFALQAGQLHMLESIVPGKTNINELYGLIQEEVDRLGYGDCLRFRDTGMLGHQIGIDCHEFPLLSNSVDYVLKPGMVFCSEPKMFIRDECYMRVEDMVLITETGAESLSVFPRDIFEVGGK